MTDDTTTIRIEKKIDMISADITGLKVDVAVLKTDVNTLKTNTSDVGKMLTKDSATDLIAYAIGEHERRNPGAPQDAGLVKAKTKVLLALAGLFSVGAGVVGTYLIN